ncbi:MAG: ABC transporter ATP-binding protein [Acidobacteriaceae bacterium]|nr:ABC transporter ATP-binding protein [Acidobacteriaceae bacterium]
MKDVSFEVHHGEMLGVVGVNGSGKSTLLKVVSGVYAPSAGKVEVNGRLASLLELGSGMHPELTGRENIILNGLLMGYSKKQMKAREQRIIDFADIGEFIDVPLKQYSSGMYARLAFSVATEVDPDILVVDEILSVGDANFAAKSFKRMMDFRDSGKTILFVTHSMQQVLQYCDRAILLEAGRLVIDGAPEEVIERYAPGTLASTSALASASEKYLASLRE